MYRALHRRFGPQHWWPGDSRLEIIVGAILTQNTSWTNVEKGLARLKQAKALSLSALGRCSTRALERWLRPVGFFRVKATRIKSFVSWVGECHGGSLSRLMRLPTAELREELLSVNGIGPETADSILLYAFRRPVFVADAYTRRVMIRHGQVRETTTYEALAQHFTRGLPRNQKLFNEYHALLVRLGKDYCRARPRCENCPLRRWLPKAGHPARDLVHSGGNPASGSQRVPVVKPARSFPKAPVRRGANRAVGRRRGSAA